MQWKAPSRLDDPGMMDIPDEEHLQARLHPVSQTCFRGSLLVSRFAYALKSRTQSLWLRYSDANQIADSLCSCQSGRYDVNRHLNANEARGQVLRVQRFGRRFSEKGRNFQAAFPKPDATGRPAQVYWCGCLMMPSGSSRIASWG